MTTSKMFKTWERRLLNERTWTESIIRQWCHSVVLLAETGRAGGKATSLARDEACILLDLGSQVGPRLLTPAHTTKGCDYLKGKHAKQLGFQSDKFDHFEWCPDEYLIKHNDYGWASGCIPVWTVVELNNIYWAYSAERWDSPRMVHERHVLRS